MLSQVKKKLTLSVGILALTAALLGSLSLPAAGQTDPTPTDMTALDLSDPQSESAVETDAREFLTLLLGDGGAISAPEADYLASLSDRPLRYMGTVPARHVSVDHTDGTLLVIAAPYTYITADGATVTWSPAETATVGETPLALSEPDESGTRTGTLEGVTDTAGLRLTVPYTCTVTLPAALTDRYLNLAFGYADELCRERTDYESRLSAYNAYRDYLQALAVYDADYAKWQAYVTKKNKYDRDLEKYTAYEQAMRDYRANLAAYEAYETAKAEYDGKKAAYDAAREAYNAEVAVFDAALLVYERKQAELARAEAMLTVLESAFVSSGGNHLYATLMGDTVATVVNKKDELVDVGKCDPDDIDRADRATRALRTLLTEYKSLTGVPARFAYYSAHYAEIKQNFIDLYGSLRSLYNNSNVKTTLINRDRLERYMQFVSQLYVISTGLDDDTNRSEDWVIAGRYDPAWYDYTYHGFVELLPDPAHRPADGNNADPSGVTCPDEIPTAPTPPAPFTLTEPTEPTAVPRPIEPETVNKPTEPTPVERPTRPTAVNDPGEKPVAPAYTALQTRLMAARDDGTLSRRDTGRETAVTLTATLQKGLQPSLVEFYDADGQTLLFSANPNVGDAVVYGGPTPQRADTAKYTYTFIGWKDEDGRPVQDFGTADTDGRRFYASYSETVRSYTVTWSVEGAESSVILPYGASPVFDGTPEKDATAQYAYRFAGWRVRGEEDYSTRLNSVTGDVTYEAVFEAALRRYTVTWVHREGHTESALWDYGTVPAPVGVPARPADDLYIYEFTGWDVTPAEVTGEATYVAQYTALPILPAADPSDEPQAPVPEDDIYTATVPVSGQQIDRLLALARENDRTVSLLSADGTVSLYLNEAALTDFLDAGGTHVKLYADGPLYVLRLTDAEGDAISLEAPVTLRFTGASAYTKAYVKADDTLSPLAFAYEDGVLTVRVREGADLLLRNEYAVTLAPCENGELSANAEIAARGDTVTLSLTPHAGYRLDGIRIVGALTGATYPVGEDMTFTMPDEPVTVSATLSRKTYTVTFTVDGQVISTRTYFSGETLVLPDDPTKESVGNKVYTFTGWSPMVVVTVTADATYTAQFRESVQGDNSVYIPPDSRNRAYLLYIELAIILALLIATPIVTVRLIKRRRRKKRMRQ